MVSVGEVEPAAVVATLRSALDAIGRLSGERAGIEEALKVEKNKDNILPRIMAAGGQHDRLFAEELKKYEPLKARLLAARAAARPCGAVFVLGTGRLAPRMAHSGDAL
jgi:hypothetical protein